MKNTKKIYNAIISITLLCVMLAIVPQAAEIKIKDFDGNAIVRTIINSIIGIVAVAGIVIGGLQIFSGTVGQDPKQRNTGIVTAIISLSIGGIILTIVNMILV